MMTYLEIVELLRECGRRAKELQERAAQTVESGAQLGEPESKDCSTANCAQNADPELMESQVR
jgi:hypothetical protein